MIDQARAFLADRISQMKEKGASAVEYGLLVAGIAAVIIVAVMTLGGTVTSAFEGTENCISTNGADGCADAPADAPAEGE